MNVGFRDSFPDTSLITPVTTSFPGNTLHTCVPRNYDIHSKSGPSRLLPSRHEDEAVNRNLSFSFSTTVASLLATTHSHNPGITSTPSSPAISQTLSGHGLVVGNDMHLHPRVFHADDG